MTASIEEQTIDLLFIRQFKERGFTRIITGLGWFLKEGIFGLNKTDRRLCELVQKRPTAGKKLRGERAGRRNQCRKSEAYTISEG